MRQLICIYLQNDIEETAYSSPSAVTEIAIGTVVLKSTFFYYKRFLPSAHRIEIYKGGLKLEIHQI